MKLLDSSLAMSALRPFESRIPELRGVAINAPPLSRRATTGSMPMSVAWLSCRFRSGQTFQRQQSLSSLSAVTGTFGRQASQPLSIRCLPAFLFDFDQRGAESRSAAAAEQPVIMCTASLILHSGPTCVASRQRGFHLWIFMLIARAGFCTVLSCRIPPTPIRSAGQKSLIAVTQRR